jgi:hypothetical protein
MHGLLHVTVSAWVSAIQDRDGRVLKFELTTNSTPSFGERESSSVVTSAASFVPLCAYTLKGKAVGSS